MGTYVYGIAYDRSEWVSMPMVSPTAGQRHMPMSAESARCHNPKTKSPNPKTPNPEPLRPNPNPNQNPIPKPKTLNHAARTRIRGRKRAVPLDRPRSDPPPSLQGA